MQAPSDSRTKMVEKYSIAYCLPVLRPADTSDTSFLQQTLVAEGMKARGHTATYIMPRDMYEVVASQDLRNLTTATRTWSNFFWFKAAAKTTWSVQQLFNIPYLNYFSNWRHYDAYLRLFPRFDLVHERNGLYRAAVAMACRRLKKPYVLFFDGDDVLEHDYAGRPLQGILRRRAKQVIRFCFQAANCVICVSDTAKKRLMNVWQVPGEKIVVFPNAVDTHAYRPDPVAGAATRQALRFDSQPLVLFVGSFYPWQDVSLLLQAFAQVLARCPEARLVLAGDGQQYAAMTELASRLGIEHAVRFTGFIPHQQVPAYVNAADVAVAPYTQMDPELFCGSSMKVFEYMACGKAVIASGIGQISDVITDGANGLLVEPGNVTALAGAIERLLGDEGLRLRLGKQAQKDAESFYSWEGYSRRLEAVYTAVLRGGNLQGL